MTISTGDSFGTIGLWLEPRQQKAPACRGFSERRLPRSVSRDERCAELVADAGDDGLDIAGLGVECVHQWRGAARQLIALGLERRIVIFEADDPVLRHAVLPACADRPAVVPLARGTGTGERPNRI